MTFEDFMTLLTDYANNVGLALGDIEEADLKRLREIAWKLSTATEAELKQREEDRV